MRNTLFYNPMISALFRPCEAGLQSCFSRSVRRYKVACTTLEGVEKLRDRKNMCCIHVSVRISYGRQTMFL